MSTETTSTLRERILATSDSSPSLLDSAGPSLLEHLQRNTLQPLADEVTRWHREVVAPLQRSTEKLFSASESLRSAIATADEKGRRDLAQLQRTAHRLTNSRARLSVRLLEFLDSLLASNRDYTAHLASSALLGDTDAREYWREQANTGDETALVLVALLDELADLDARESVFITETAETVAEVSLAALDLDTAGNAPPMEVVLCGSVFRNAP